MSTMKKKNTTEVTDSIPTQDSEAVKNPSALAKKDKNREKIALYQGEPLPGNRPIGAANFEISQMISIAGNRPIGASNIQVLETRGIMGNRPIVSSQLKIHDMMSFSGNRPITVSNLNIYDFLMGGRPIASNDIDDPETLMGYLD